MRPQIAAHFRRARVYQGGLTYNAHPISLAAAIANIQVMQDDHLVERAAGDGPCAAAHADRPGRAAPFRRRCANLGLFGILELVKDRQTREPLAPYNGSSPEMTAFRKYMLDHGLYIYTHWHTVLIIPPLIITEQQLEAGFAVIDQALEIADRAVTG